MTLPNTLRVLGTGYLGKEPFEYTADVLRCVVRASGVEYGFESCLTSRPFTARTFLTDRPGAIAPGRGTSTGADRVILDLADGLDALAWAGFHVSRVKPAGDLPAPRDGQAVVVGPLPVPNRWAQAADRLVLDQVWRHVVIDEWAGNSVICLDPTVGGYTALPRTDLARPGVEVAVITVPDNKVDTTALARLCLARGATWRAAEIGDDRDERGFAYAAANVAVVTAGGGRRRMRLSLANYALHTMRAGALLGSCGSLSTNQLALADLLGDAITECCTAQHALREQDNAVLTSVLRRLSTVIDAVGELYVREAAVTE